MKRKDKNEGLVGLPPRPDFRPRDPEDVNLACRLLRMSEDYKRKSVRLRRMALVLRGQ